jgi:hypothetical protein
MKTGWRPAKQQIQMLSDDPDFVFICFHRRPLRLPSFAIFATFCSMPSYREAGNASRDLTFPFGRHSDKGSDPS